jgi:putative oxidoreductase
MNNTTTLQYNPLLPLIGRIFLGALFVVAGYGKLTGFAGFAGYLTKLGFPAPEAMAVLAILFELGGGILLIVGWQTRWVAWALVIFVVIATFAAHRFWDFDAAQRTMQMTQFLKNFAVIGGLLMVAAFGPGSASLDRR